MVARTLMLTASYIQTLRRSAIVVPLMLLVLCTLVTGCAETAPIIAPSVPYLAASHTCRIVVGSHGYEVVRFYPTMITTSPALSNERSNLAALIAAGL